MRIWLVVFISLFQFSIFAQSKDEKPPAAAKCPEMEKHWQANFDKCVASATASQAAAGNAEVAKEGCRCMTDWMIRGRSCDESLKATPDDTARYAVGKCKNLLESLKSRVKIK